LIDLRGGAAHNGVARLEAMQPSKPTFVSGAWPMWTIG
jgi:hypothetical protein